MLVCPHNINDARYALWFAQQVGLPVIVLGGGNNLLVSDRGVQAVVLKLQGILSRAQFDGEEAVAGAGVSLAELIREAAAHGYGGLEEFAGIPASIGGALAMNVTRDRKSTRLELQSLRHLVCRLLLEKK